MLQSFDLNWMSLLSWQYSSGSFLPWKIHSVVMACPIRTTETLLYSSSLLSLTGSSNMDSLCCSPVAHDSTPWSQLERSPPSPLHLWVGLLSLHVLTCCLPCADNFSLILEVSACWTCSLLQYEPLGSRPWLPLHSRAWSWAWVGIQYPLYLIELGQDSKNSHYWIIFSEHWWSRLWNGENNYQSKIWYAEDIW